MGITNGTKSELEGSEKAVGKICENGARALAALRGLFATQES